MPVDGARIYLSSMNGFLKDGPAAGLAVEAGDPPIRRGVIVLGATAFGESACRYYLSAIDSSGAVYSYGGEVRWPPEAGPRVIKSAETVHPGGLV
jgi:hypothetical protein